MTDWSPFHKRSERWWHGTFWVVIAVAATLVTFVLGGSLRDRLLALGLLGVLAVAYAWVGSGCISRREQRLPFIVGYSLLALACTLLLTRGIGTGYLVLFIVIAQVWAILPLPYPPLLMVVTIAALVVSEAQLSGWRSDDVGQWLLLGIVSLAFSLLAGFWITGIVNESSRRRDLISELERTRSALGQAERDAGVLAERERLAGEIHDTLAQGFMSILVQSEAALSDISATADLNDASDVRRRLDLIEHTARDNLAEARALIEALQPTGLREHSLADAVRRILERFTMETDIRTSLDIDGEPRQLPPNTEVVLLRTTQEALSNVRKHARNARLVDIFLSYGKTKALVSIKDDGHGFEPSEKEGFGLRGMRARACQVGGTVQVESAPGSGTTIRVEVPA